MSGAACRHYRCEIRPDCPPDMNWSRTETARSGLLLISASTPQVSSRVHVRRIVHRPHLHLETGVVRLPDEDRRYDANQCRPSPAPDSHRIQCHGPDSGPTTGTGPVEHPSASRWWPWQAAPRARLGTARDPSPAAQTRSIGRGGKDFGGNGMSHLAMIDLHFDDDGNVLEPAKHLAQCRNTHTARPKGMAPGRIDPADTRHRPERARPPSVDRPGQRCSWCGRASRRDTRRPPRLRRDGRPVPARRRPSQGHARTRPGCSPVRARSRLGAQTRVGRRRALKERAPRHNSAEPEPEPKAKSLIGSAHVHTRHIHAGRASRSGRARRRASVAPSARKSATISFGSSAPERRYFPASSATTTASCPSWSTPCSRSTTSSCSACVDRPRPDCSAPSRRCSTK